MAAPKAGAGVVFIEENAAKELVAAGAAAAPISKMMCCNCFARPWLHIGLLGSIGLYLQERIYILATCGWFVATSTDDFATFQGGFIGPSEPEPYENRILFQRKKDEERLLLAAGYHNVMICETPASTFLP